MKDHLPSITSLLMGAAFADQRLDGRELAAARHIVLQLNGTDRMPKPLSDIMVFFKPEEFELDATVAKLRDLPKAGKRKVLELIGTINEADDEIDIAEDVYLEAVAHALGLEEAEFSDLTLSVLDDEALAELSAVDLADFVEEEPSGPPPPPKKASKGPPPPPKK
jgi:uncharacterized tellurite resistance protein B-like protein